MTIRAKFKLVAMRSYIAEMYNYETKTSSPAKFVDLEWRVVNPNRDNPTDENKQYWSSTPTGDIKFATVNQAAVDDVELGKEYYVTFQEVPGDSGC